MDLRALSGIALIAALSFVTSRASQAPPASKPTRFAAPVCLECDQGLIDPGAYLAHSGPLFADLDGDKKPELLVGDFNGFFQLYANVGEPGKPKFVAKGLLKAAGKDAHVENW